MSNTPPLFGDLEKSAKDLFDKNFGALNFGRFLLASLMCVALNN